MSGYQAPDGGPGFPEIHWSKTDNGGYRSEWNVRLAGPSKLLPLALAASPGLRVELEFIGEVELIVRILSTMKPNRPEVYSHFYQLLRPAFDAGLIRAIDGGDMAVHAYVFRGTCPGPVVE